MMKHSVQSTDVEMAEIQIEESERRLSEPNAHGFSQFITSRYSNPKMVGNVRCYWYGKDGVPRITIGPTWMFALPVFVGVVIAAYFFVQGLLVMSNLHPGLIILSWVLLICNIFAYLYTLFANQGIPREIFVKQLLIGGQATNEVNTSSLSNKSDSFKTVTLESESESPTQYQSSNTRRRRCDICDIKQQDFTVHCRLCGVCVELHDHHCVFFSKCIGGGNLESFRCTLGLFVTFTIYYTCLIVI